MVTSRKCLGPLGPTWVQLRVRFGPKMVRKLRRINEGLNGYEPEGREFESLRAHHFPPFIFLRCALRSSSARRSSPGQLPFSPRNEDSNCWIRSMLSMSNRLRSRTLALYHGGTQSCPGSGKTSSKFPTARAGLIFRIALRLWSVAREVD